MTIRESSSDMLSDLGCEVVTAPGPREALEKLSADARIELLFTDIEMPIMDGYALAEKAQNIRRGLRVIVTSGRAQDRLDLPLVHKPFGAEAVARVMEKTIGRC
jgi:CheY-like chemotaxis protein